jgi:hypothetical protein
MHKGEMMSESRRFSIGKLLLIAAFVAVPISGIGVGGGVALASSPHSAANDTIVCKKLTGAITFSPKIDAAGYTSGSLKTTVSTTLSGCTVKGPTPETVSKGTTTGTLISPAGTKTAPSGKCTSLTKGGAVTGTLTTKWTASVATPNSVVVVKSDKAGTAGSHGTLTLPGTLKGSASGSFLGTNKGASDTTTSEASATSTVLAAQCLSKGLPSLKLQNAPGVNAVSLG